MLRLPRAAWLNAQNMAPCVALHLKHPLNGALPSRRLPVKVCVEGFYAPKALGRSRFAPGHVLSNARSLSWIHWLCLRNSYCLKNFRQASACDLTKSSAVPAMKNPGALARFCGNSVLDSVNHCIFVLRFTIRGANFFAAATFL
jgi:hypothetical protein